MCNNDIVLGLAEITLGITNPLYSLNAEFSTLKFHELESHKLMFSLFRLGKEYHFESLDTIAPDIN